MSRYMVTDNMEAAVAVAFAVTAHAVAEVLLSEAGLIAAVVLGVTAANQRVVPTACIKGFGETLKVLIIGVLFVLLGALVDVGDLVALAWPAAALVAVLVIVLRPLSAAAVVLSTGVVYSVSTPAVGRALGVAEPSPTVSGWWAMRTTSTRCSTTPRSARRSWPPSREWFAGASSPTWSRRWGVATCTACRSPGAGRRPVLRRNRPRHAL